MRLVFSALIAVLSTLPTHAEESVRLAGPPYPCDAVRPTDDGKLETLKKVDLGGGFNLGAGGKIGTLQHGGIDIVADIRARCFGLKPAK